MRRLLALCLLFSSASPAGAAGHLAVGPPPVATFSIVAIDPANGDLGVAVASRYFSVGSVVPWALAGVGAVATQATTPAATRAAASRPRCWWCASRAGAT
jgi:hypothetical protein